MSHYSARVEVADGMLHVSRPLTAPDAVTDLVESLVYAVRDNSGGVTVAALEVDTADESATPIGDSIPSTSSTPINDSGQHEDTVEPLTAPPGTQS